jgi:hypothetical protein
MQYVLGNMLNGAGGLNADGLSLDLQFAADKTLTARKGPTPVFTRGSTGTFVGSNGLIQSAAVNAARFDHDSAGVCRGLLIEESRTNLFQRSDDFGNAYWTKLRSTITSDTTTSPSGATDADKLIEDTSSNTHIVFRLVGVGVTTPVSFSVFAKASERSWIQLECGDNFPAGATAYFNLSNGTIGTVGAGATASIQSMGNGWYRCVVVATPTATTGNGFYIYAATANGTRSYTGDGTSGLFLWGAQVEAGSFPTSYIPTVASSVVRSADVCSITGSDFNTVYNQSEVSIFSELEFQANNASAVVHCNNGTANEVLALTQFASPSRLAIFVTDGGVTQASVNANANLNQVYKTAISAKLNSFQFVLNGVLGTRDTSGTMPTPTQINIGKTQSAVHLNGHIKQIKIFRKQLSDAKLQALTV